MVHTWYGYGCHSIERPLAYRSENLFQAESIYYEVASRPTNTLFMDNMLVFLIPLRKLLLELLLILRSATRNIAPRVDHPHSPAI